jgi:WD40 repeat protein
MMMLISSRVRVQSLMLCLMTGIAGHVTTVGQEAGDGVKATRDADGDPLPPNAVMRLGTARWRHPGRFKSLHWLPDGKQLIVNCSLDGVRRLDAENGRLLGTYELPAISPHATALSPDGKELVYRSMGGVVAIDSSTGEKVRDYPGTGWWMFHYSASGKYLVSATQEDYDVIDRKTGKVVVTWKTDSELKGFTFSADESQLYVASLRPSIAVLDIAKKKVVRRWSDDDDHFVRGPALSPDGRLFAVGGQDIAVVDDATGDVQFRLAGDKPDMLFQHLQFTHDGERLIALAQGGDVYIWDVRSQKRLAKLEGSVVGDGDMQISPDGKRLALASNYVSRVWVWDLEHGKLLHDEPGHARAVKAIAYSRDGLQIATGSIDKETQVWDAATGKLRAKLPTPASSLLTFADGGKSVLTSHLHTETMSDWKLGPPPTESKLTFVTPREPDAITSIWLSQDQHRLLRLTEAFEKKSWNMEVTDFPSMKAMASAKVGGISRSGAITADGKLVAFGRENDIQLYDVDAKKMVGALKGHTYYPEAMAFTPDGKTLVSGSCDRTLIVWNIAERKLVHALEGQGRTVAAVAISPNGRVAATCGTDRCREPCQAPVQPPLILFWDIRSGEELAGYSGHDVDGQALAFSPDGKRLASGLNDGTTIVWETPELAWK